MSDVVRIVARGGEVVLVTEPAPEPRRGEVLVATQYSVISPGTDMMSQVVMAVPMLGLYIVSIAIAFIFQKKRIPATD